MANRNWASAGKIYSMHVMPVMVDMDISIGASGAPTLSQGTKVVASVSRSGAGTYAIQLKDNFKRIISAYAMFVSPSGSVSGIQSVELADNGTSIGSGLVNIKTLAATSSSVTTPVATDPANGSVLKLALILSNSSV